eukprot:UN28883
MVYDCETVVGDIAEDEGVYRVQCFVNCHEEESQMSGCSTEGMDLGSSMCRAANQAGIMKGEIFDVQIYNVTDVIQDGCDEYGIESNDWEESGGVEYFVIEGESECYDTDCDHCLTEETCEGRLFRRNLGTPIIVGPLGIEINPFSSASQECDSRCSEQIDR